MQPATCLNCESVLQPNVNFCSNCGQKTHLHRLDFHYILHEAVHFITHTDKGIFYLIKKLSYAPGHVARNFIGGKRKQYISPLNFYLIIIGLFVFTLSTFKTFEQPTNFAQWRADVLQIKDKTERERKLLKLDRSEKASKFMSKHSNLVNLFAATPLASFLFFLFYRKQKYNFIEHLVANFYYAGFSALVFILLAAPVINLFKSTLVYLIVIACYLFFELVYRSIAYYQFINKKGIKHYLYAFLASLTTIASWAFLSRWAVEYYIANGFKPFL